METLDKESNSKKSECNSSFIDNTYKAGDRLYKSIINKFIISFVIASLFMLTIKHLRNINPVFYMTIYVMTIISFCVFAKSIADKKKGAIRDKIKMLALRDIFRGNLIFIIVNISNIFGVDDAVFGLIFSGMLNIIVLFDLFIKMYCNSDTYVIIYKDFFVKRNKRFKRELIDKEIIIGLCKEIFALKGKIKEKENGR